MNSWIQQFNHLDHVKNYHVTAGGLSFNKPNLSSVSHTIKNINLTSEDLLRYEKIMKDNETNPIITNIGLPTNFDMAKQAKTPIKLKQIIPDNLSDLEIIDNMSGVIDMLIKNGNQIIVPKELCMLENILVEAYKFESHTNKNIENWNMWLLVDIRPVQKFHTQRNAGYHYDGMALAGKHSNCPVTSIYSWANKLPTRFYTGKVTFPNNFDSKCNANIIAQKQTKKQEDIFASEEFCLYKFDGTTVHTGIESSENIYDRVFIRICFTAPNVLFDRLGNTVNPCLSYNFLWRVVKDPIVTFKSIVQFDTPNEFKNLWDVACQGHPAFSCQHEGNNSFEYKLIKKLKKKYGRNFILNIIKLYEEEIQLGNVVSEIRKNILIEKYY